MADYPTINLESQLIGRGLNPSSPSTTYTDFADRIAKNMRDQAQMEQALAEAKERTKQSRLTTTQKTEAAKLGVNPELTGLMTKEAARDHLELLIEAKKLKIAPETIAQWYDSLPAMVKASDVEDFLTSLTKSTGSLSARVYKDTAVMQDESGQDRMYNVSVRGDGTRTALYDPDTFDPLFPDELVEAYGPEEAKKKLSAGVRQLAGQEARFSTQRQMFDQKQWTAFEKSANVSNAPAARAIGQAAVNNMRAERALKLLNKGEDMSTNEYDIVVSDLAAIFKGGVPDIVSLEHQRYDTIQADLAKWKQYLTSQPAGVKTPEVRKRLKDVTMDVKDVDNEIIMRYIGSVSSAYKPYIQQDPERALDILNPAVRNMGIEDLTVADTKDLESALEKKIQAHIKKAVNSNDIPDSPAKTSEQSNASSDKKAALREKLGLGKKPSSGK